MSYFCLLLTPDISEMEIIVILMIIVIWCNVKQDQDHVYLGLKPFLRSIQETGGKHLGVVYSIISNIKNPLCQSYLFFTDVL